MHSETWLMICPTLMSEQYWCCHYVKLYDSHRTSSSTHKSTM